MNGYTGPGFMRTTAALRRIVDAQFQERWALGAIPAEEAEIWDRLGAGLAGELWEQHLLIMIKPPRSTTMVQRAADYQAAFCTLRDALISEQVTARIIEDDGSLREIEPRCWRTDDGGNAVLRGWCQIDEGLTEVNRLILLPEKEIDALLSTPRDPSPIKSQEKSATKEDIFPKRSKGGRPPKHDPNHVRTIVFELMDLHGDFTSDDPEWNARARLEDAVRAKLRSDIGTTQLRKAIKPHLTAWLSAKVGNC